MRRLVLYRFRYYDQLRRRWVRARYVLEAPAIRCQYPDYELIGSPEIRYVQPKSYEHFDPFGPSAPAPVCIAPMLVYTR